MSNLKADMQVHGIDVEFSGEPVTVDESFSHAFGIEEKIGVTCENITWYKEGHSNEENQLIMNWLLQDNNLDKVIDLLIKQFHK